LIILIGANSSITQDLVAQFSGETVLLVGRSKPIWLNKFKDESVRYLSTEYQDANFLEFADTQTSGITVVFVGISAKSSLIVDIDNDDFLKDLDLNLNFAAKVTKWILPKMITQGYGRFVFLGSKEASRGTIGAASYAIIKQGQIGLSRTIAVEYARFGITSNVIQLGLLAAGSRNRIRSPKELKDLVARIPTSADLETSDIAETIKALMKTKSINGTIIDIDQGVR
jgi:3-oxoacyl-[acyl-carrier protein] reductase